MSIDFRPCVPWIGVGEPEPPLWEEANAQALNVANGNARILLRALGLDDDDELAGTAEVTDFRSRLALATALTDDTGTPDSVDGAAVDRPGATIVDCGLPPGYFADRFAALAEILDWCERHDVRQVEWF